MNERAALIANIHRAAPQIFRDHEVAAAPISQLEMIARILHGTQRIPSETLGKVREVVTTAEQELGLAPPSLPGDDHKLLPPQWTPLAVRSAEAEEEFGLPVPKLK
jgi:hypothetical protein